MGGLDLPGNSLSKTMYLWGILKPGCWIVGSVTIVWLTTEDQSCLHCLIVSTNVMSGHIGLHAVELDAQYVCIHRANLEIKCSEKRTNWTQNAFETVIPVESWQFATWVSLVMSMLAFCVYRRWRRRRWRMFIGWLQRLKKRPPRLPTTNLVDDGWRDSLLLFVLVTRSFFRAAVP